MSIQITVDGKDEFNRAFNRLDASFDDLSPIWPDVRDHFWQIEKDQFASEGGKGGSGRWKQLSERYNKQKIARYGAGKGILEASGRLMKSLTGNNPGSVYTATKTDIAVGTMVPYGIYHQRGSGNLPERKPISFSADQRKSMMKVIQKALIKELRSGRYYVPVTDR